MEGVFPVLPLSVDVDSEGIVGVEFHECDYGIGLEEGRLHLMGGAFGFGPAGLPVGDGHFGIVRKSDAYRVAQGVLGVGGN